MTSAYSNVGSLNQRGPSMTYFTRTVACAAMRKAGSTGFDPRNSAPIQAHAYATCFAMFKANRIRRMVSYVSRGTTGG